MIISASRRTDIPAFYSDWFINRIKAGYVRTINPRYPEKSGKVSLLPEDVDGIVFWSKNPKPMLTKLHELKDIPYYFQFTITPYDTEWEPGLPDKQAICNTFKELSKMIGPGRVIWRYDPIIFTKSMDMEYHVQAFTTLAKELQSYTNKCVVSFVDMYGKILGPLKKLGVEESTLNQRLWLLQCMAYIANDHGLKLETCAEADGVTGVTKGRCIDPDLFGTGIKYKKDPGQRRECGCAVSKDIGEYSTCRHMCKYCYANTDADEVKTRAAMHDPLAEYLIP